MSEALPDFIKLPDNEEYNTLLQNLNVNAQEIYDSINDRIKEIMTNIEGREPTDEEVKEFASRIHHEEESYLEILWRDTPVARVFPIEIKREKIEGDLYNYKLKQEFMDLTK
jgi:hypothetical protein